MKADANHDWNDDEAAELRAALRGWTVPPPPTEIEDALRGEFRRRRRRPPSAVWLSLAAAVVLLAVWSFVSARLGGRPSVARVPSQPLGPSAADERRSEPIRPTARRASRATAVPNAVKPEPAVVVEPAQAELLAEFGRRAWERAEAAQGASLPRMPAAEAPAYRAEWEEVAGEWPAVQVVVPKSER